MIATLNKSKTALTINRQEFKLALEKIGAGIDKQEFVIAVQGGLANLMFNCQKIVFNVDIVFLKDLVHTALFHGDFVHFLLLKIKNKKAVLPALFAIIHLQLGGIPSF